MNLTTWAWIIGIVIVVAGLWYFLSGPSTMTPSSAATTTGSQTTNYGSTGSGDQSSTGGTGTTPGAAATVIGFGSISDLIAMDKTLVCSIDTAVGGGRRFGTVYVEGGMMRGDFVSTTNSTTALVSMVDDGTSLYLWNNQNMSGLKVPATGAGGSAIASNGGIDPSTGGSYACHSWVGDSS
ncbi:MAG: hypothetical protein ACREGR_01860, partial [Minisyncoccia bacterium]